MSVSQPLASSSSQLPWVTSQVGGLHVPLLHETAVAPALEQVPVQLPQCWMLLDVSVSQPSAAVQSAWCCTHSASTQLESTQAELALANWHSLPQPPQCWASLRV